MSVECISICVEVFILRHAVFFAHLNLCISAVHVVVFPSDFVIVCISFVQGQDKGVDGLFSLFFAYEDCLCLVVCVGTHL